MEQRKRQSCGLDVEGAPGIDEWQSLNQDRRIECSLDTEKCFSQFGCGVCKTLCPKKAILTGEEAKA